MITAKEAMKKVASANKDRVVTGGCDYGEYYIFEMPTRGSFENGETEIDPYFAVRKSDGEIFGYSPAGEFAKFYSAMEEKPLRFSEMEVSK